MYHVFHIRAFKKVKEKKNINRFTHMYNEESMHQSLCRSLQNKIFLFEDKNLKRLSHIVLLF